MLSTDFFPLDVTNFGTTISKIQAAKPDLILSALVGGNHTAFYRQWTSAGMEGKIPIASTTFGLVNEPTTLDAAESDSILGSYGYSRSSLRPPPRASSRRSRRRIRTRPMSASSLPVLMKAPCSGRKA